LHFLGHRIAGLAIRERAEAAPIRKLKLNGFVLNSHTDGEYLDDPKYWPVLEAAEALGACIYIHPRGAFDGLKGPLQDYGMDSALNNAGRIQDAIKITEQAHRYNYGLANTSMRWRSPPCGSPCFAA